MTLIALALPPAALAAASFRTPGGAVYCGESEGEPPLALICWRPADGLTAWMTRLGRSSFRIDHKVQINYYRPRGDNKEGWDNIDIIGWLGYPMQIKVNFLCRDSILAAPVALDIALFLDLARRAGMSGIQEWLSFYFKSPMVAEGLYPEHDLFIQQTKLKNTLRHWMGEELITHLGTEYYAEH